MKGNIYGLKTRQVSVLLLALICTTILIWAWQRAPRLMSSLPQQQSQFLQLSPETLFIDPVDSTTLSKPGIHDNKDASLLVDNSNTREQLTPEESYPNLSESTPEQLQEVRKKQADQRVDLYSNTTSTTSVDEDAKISMVTKQEQACNYGKGRWIVDNSRPLYSGFSCKGWLAEMWACRLTQRKDFAYEKLRWLPKDCYTEKFEKSKFLERMRDRTLAFVGDSLGRQQFQSLMCMVTGGEDRPDVQDVGWEFDLIKAQGSVRPDGWAYRFPTTNTTILYYWSASLCDLEPRNVSDPMTDYAMHLDRPPAFLRRFLHKIDVLVLNTGHHWNRGKLNGNRWVMYVGGVPNTNMQIARIGNAKNLTIHSVVKWVDSQLPMYPRLKAFYRSISPRHFFNGEWNTGGTCDNMTPSSQGLEVSEDDSSDPVAALAVKGTRVKLLDITALSQLRDEGHISRYSIKATPGVQDCLHWCLPGIPDTWNELLFALI